MTTTSTAPTMMPNPIAGDAMHRGAEHLTPTGRDVFLVLASKRFTTAEHVEERPERAGECGQDYEGPLEDRRLRVVRQISMTTNRKDGTVRIHHTSMTPSSMRNRLSRLLLTERVRVVRRGQSPSPNLA